ncbi:hypothetical protein WMY93_018551 [Mugilogobius chulae]|uniref:RING-type E3 ubiquitin transferase n=1 Tax=Mugilogobius chulae TaxID=88201 RepID=A0AAW0NP19_9GOBI
MVEGFYLGAFASDCSLSRLEPHILELRIASSGGCETQPSQDGPGQSDVHTSACGFRHKLRSHCSVLFNLQKVPHSNRLKPGQSVPYAVIEGSVKAVKETLSSQFVDNCKGVIERLTLKEKKMVWNRTTHLYAERGSDSVKRQDETDLALLQSLQRASSLPGNDTEKLVHQRINSVPFAIGSLDESVSSSVRVIRPLEASELELDTTYQIFHPTVESLTNAISHFISGERPKGILETEEMLKVGETLTGVGELVLDNSLIKLQPPKEVATCSTLAYILWRKFTHYRRKQRQRRLLDEFNEQQRQRFQDLNLEEGTVSPTACTVCLSQERECVFLECGHVCSCLQCYEALPAPKNCPICRGLIQRVVPLYNS